MAKKKKSDKAEVETKEDRINAIVAAVNKTTKDEGSVVLLNDDQIIEVPSISSGVFSLDRILGIGGFPHGRIVELFSEPSVGKSTLCLQTVASVQKNGGLCAYADVENALDVSYAAKLGVDVKSLMLSQPNCGEDTLNIVERFSELLGGGDLVVVDSVAALTPRSEIQGEVGDQYMGLQARMMGQAMRKLVSKVAQSGVTVLFINQVRNTMGGMGYGPQTTTPGGKSLKFAASVRLEIKRTGAIKRGEEVVGHKTKFKVVKNKVAPPFREAEVELRFGKGFDPVYDLINCAVKEELIQRSGAWFYYNDSALGQGVDKAAEVLQDSPEVIEHLESKLREIYFGKKE